MTHRIAVIQMRSSAALSENLPVIERLVKEAARDQVEAIFLPENFGALANPAPRSIGELESTPAGPLRELLSTLAVETGSYIFAGTIPCSVRPDGSEVTDGRVRAASFVFNGEGVAIARYDKIHMFDVDVEDSHKHYLESATFEPGEEVVCVSTPIGKVGLSVCYDIRFPELYRLLLAKGAECFAIPSAFTRLTGAAHFEVLMRARAIENCAFTIAACQGGIHDSGRETYGHSMVISPWGEVLCRGGDDEEILYADLDLALLARIRRDMPVDKQRRV